MQIGIQEKYSPDYLTNKERGKGACQVEQGNNNKTPPQKGNLQDCKNWHGITLLPVDNKIMEYFIIKRIETGIDKMFRNEQAYFRKGRNTVEQIFVLSNILEHITYFLHSHHGY